VETVQVTITEPSDVESSLLQASQLTCTNDAQITLSATGGTAPYEYSVDNVVFSPMSGGNTHTFTVVAGVYQYYVRDSFGCEASISNQVSIDPIPPLTIGLDLSAAVINCTGEATATIMAEATGGLGNYSYELFSDAALTTLLTGPQPGGDFSGLIAGSYYIRVVSGDCVEVTNEIVITEPVPLQIDRQEFTNVTCAGEADGTITVEVSGGTGNILYAITPNLNQFDTVNAFIGLAPGVYDVIAQDENGCFIPFQFTITEPAPVTATFVAEPEICAGNEDGTITVSIAGGTAPYRTALNTTVDSAFVQDQFFYSDLAAGTYVVFIRDAQDCEANVIVVIEPGVNLNGIVEPVYECTGAVPDNYLNITMDDPSVLGSIMYALDSTAPADMQLNPDFTNIAPGSHYIAISHANGCVLTIDFEIENFDPLTLVLEQNNINEITAIATGGLEDYTFIFDGDDNGTDNTYFINRTDTFTVRVIDANGCEVEAQIFMEFIDIELPNFFTPDGDGMNDTWVPRNMEGFPEILTIIFDRYGRELYRITLNSTGWDGMYQGSMLPTGDYWYVVKLNGERDEREFVGHFTLYR
jgi:gliding motility-associated-like protein